MKQPNVTEKMKTECSKCKAPAPVVKHRGTDPVSALFKASFVMTGYRCDSCSHFNDFTRRKGFAEWKTGKKLK